MVENICAISMLIFLYAIIGMISGLFGSASSEWSMRDRRATYNFKSKESEEEFDSKMLCLSGIAASISGFVLLITILIQVLQ